MHGNTCGNLLKGEFATDTGCVVGTESTFHHVKVKRVGASVLIDASRDLPREAREETGHSRL